MDNVRTIRRVALYSIKKNLNSTKLYIVLILSAMYIHFMLNPIKDFAQNVNMNVTPYCFPFLLTSGYSIKIFLLLITLFFCDAPFFDNAHIYVLIRSGRRKWCLGQQFYIGGTAGAYTVFLLCMTVLVLFPNVRFESGWGKIINTFAQTGIAPMHGIPISFDYSIILTFTPLKAMALEIILCWLLFTLIGNVIFSLNLLISNFAGTVVAVLIILFQMVAEEIAPILTHFSPASWLSFELLDIRSVNDYPDISYAVIMLVALNIMVLLITVMAIKYQSIKKKNS